MPIADIIPHFATDPVVIYRRGRRWERNGDFYPGPLVAIPMTAVVYPAKGNELMQKNSGEVSEESVWVVTAQEVYTSIEPDVREADLVLYQGKYYSVTKAQGWPSGGYFRCIATKIAHTPLARSIYFGVGLVGYFENVLPVEDQVAYLRLFLLQIQTHKEMYFEVEILDDTSETIILAMPVSLGTELEITVDDEPVSPTVVTTLEIDDVPTVVYSIAAPNGPRKVLVK